jgi:hypothetical protein
MDLEKQCEGGDYIQLRQDSDQWRDLVNMAMNIPVPKNQGILDFMSDYLLFKEDPVRWSLHII